MADKTYRLPDGTSFVPWQDETNYTKILHVSQKNGSLAGDGSEAKPFLTVSQAVPFATPGTKVIIHEGIYREAVRPIYSGKSNTEMVMFCGAEGENVEITGEEIFNGTFRESEGWKRQEGLVWNKIDFDQADAKVYMAKLDRNAFVGMNPFSMSNGPMIPWYGGVVGKQFHAKSDEARQTTTLRRGILFADGERIEQVVNYFQLGEKDNRFFVEDDGITVHIRFKGDTAPEEHTLSYTARELCFCPEERYFSYLHIKNINFTKAGSGFPPPQRGIFSTNCGHHWMIEDCKVLDANGVGADIGFQCPNRLSNEPRGFQIVRNCEFSRCGIVGLTGTTGNSETVHYYDSQQEGLLIEGCKFFDNCYFDFEGLCENASLKIHRMKNSVIAHNYISGAKFGCGIWADANNENLLVEGNVVLHTKQTYGGIFMEASKERILLQHNIVVDSKKNHDHPNGGCGLYSHSSDNIETTRNIALACENGGVVHHRGFGDVQRTDGGTGPTGFDFDTFENIISDCDTWVLLGPTRCKVDGNIYGTCKDRGPLRIERDKIHLNLQHWQRHFDFDLHGRMANISYSLEDQDSRLVITIDGKTYDINLLTDLAPQIDAIFS